MSESRYIWGATAIRSTSRTTYLESNLGSLVLFFLKVIQLPSPLSSFDSSSFWFSLEYVLNYLSYAIHSNRRIHTIVLSFSHLFVFIE